MKFNTLALIKAVNAEIATREKIADEAFATAEREYENAKAEWLASEQPAILAAAARSVVEKVRKGRIVTRDDLRDLESAYRKDHAFCAIRPERKTTGRKPNTATLEALRDFLSLITDDEVTSSGLREVGFRNIAAILRTAASA